MRRISTEEIQPFEIEHISQMRAMAPECMVLLKRNGDFPLNAPGEIALYGAGARRTIKGGTGSGDVNVRHYVTIEEGLKNAGFHITTESWLDEYDKIKEQKKTAFFEDILRVAEETGKSAFFLGMGAVIPEPEYDLPLQENGEVAIYVLSRVSGEGSDRKDEKGDLRLSDTEIRDIRQLHQNFKKFLLVLNVGGVVDLSEVAEVENILLLSQLGTVTGDAFADVLLGKSFPSGKLTATWAAAEDYCSIGDFGEQDDTRYREGIYVGYRYFDTARKNPLFPFGYGLGYTDFTIEAESLEVREDTIELTACVKNTGCFPGKETIQLYCSAPNGMIDHPYQELVAFRKTCKLEPGEQQKIILSVKWKDLSSFDIAKTAWVLEQGTYWFQLGSSSREAKLCGSVHVDETQIICKVHSAGGDPDFHDWVPENPKKVRDGEEISSVPVVRLSALEPEPIQQKSHDQDLSMFSLEEKIQICLGKYSANDGPASIIGSAASTVAGAAGETADAVSNHDYGKLVMADGPAGLRLNTSFRVSGSNAEPLDLGSMEMYLELMKAPVRDMIHAKLQENRKIAEKEGQFWQYCSAIPIATAIAQSWNGEVAEKLGSIVGEEMELFGVNIWLAPAMNIQRSPLCGRNFEYYSEDPVLSGKIAASLIRGVQSRPGRGVTIKHFCANNQETNRFRSNSIVSQRALREIYLKGFEIAVREADPVAVMTSYNLLNGEHTCCRADLIEDVLRQEWGFSGIVMTDWHVTNATMFSDAHYPSASAAGCVRAGNDLVMPGNQADFQDIQDALTDKNHPYAITEESLNKCVSRVCNMAKKLK